MLIKLLGSLPVAYLSTWGPRTGTGQLPAARMAFGATVVLPAIVQWLSSIAWDGLVGLFGGEALSTLLHIPFWAGVLIVLALQGAVGIFGYELIHRVDCGAGDAVHDDALFAREFVEQT